MPRLRLRAIGSAALLGCLAVGGYSARAAADSVPQLTLTEQEVERIRKVLDRLQSNQDQILRALEEIHTELDVVRVRVTR